MAENIYRPLNDSDKAFIDVNLNRPKRQKTTREQFTIKLHEEEQNATKKHLPFARHACKDDFEKDLQKQINEQLDEYGELLYPEKLTVPEMDWEKYSDLKNFTLVKEDEVLDTGLTQRNPGLTVMIKKYEYYYGKQKYRKYRVMEEPSEAIKRAQEKSWKSRQQFDKK